MPHEIVESDALRSEYTGPDLGKGVRGKHLASFAASTNLVLLAPDVAEAFPTPDAVNDALRSLIAVAERAVHRGDVPATPYKR